MQTRVLKKIDKFLYTGRSYLIEIIIGRVQLTSRRFSSQHADLVFPDLAHARRQIAKPLLRWPLLPPVGGVGRSIEFWQK